MDGGPMVNNVIGVLIRSVAGTWTHTDIWSASGGRDSWTKTSDAAHAIKLLVRKTICFSRPIAMHEIVIGLFMNRFEFGVNVQLGISTKLIHYRKKKPLFSDPSGGTTPPSESEVVRAYHPTQRGT